MIVEEYSLKFSTLSMYSCSLMYNLRDEMSHFVIALADLVMEECRTATLRDDMTLARLIVYALSIEESKNTMMAKILKRLVQVI